MPLSNPFRNPFRKEDDSKSPTRVVFGNPFREEQPTGASANFAAREFASRRAANNILATPDASGELLANAINAGRATVGEATRYGINNARRVVGMEPTPNPSFGERYAAATENEGGFQGMLRGIPHPTIEKTFAAAESIPALFPGGESPGEAYQRNVSEDEAFQSKLRAEHPMASAAGDVGGDILSLFLGRRASGADKLVQRAETRLGGTLATSAAKSLAGDVDKILRGPAMQKLARGGVRSLESGAEAAALDVLKDPNADPLETAALAAGGQLVGSGFLGASQGLLAGGGVKGAALNLTVAAVSTMGLLQMLKSATPGGQDRILESVESGYSKVVLMMGLGAASAAIGATRYGRGNTNLSNQTRVFLDGLATTHRGTLLSLLSDWTNGDDKERAAIEKALTGVSTNPDFAGSNDAERAIVQRLRVGVAPETIKYTTGGSF